MALKFEPITLQKQAVYLDRFSRCPQKTSDYSFVNIWSWSEHYGLEWAWSNGLVWLRQSRPQAAYWAPVGEWDDVDWRETVTAALETAAPMIRVPEELGRRWQGALGDGVKVSETPDQWDYIYEREALATLSGNRFHKKKNLLNQFTRKYEFEYVPLSPAIIEQALSLQENWCTWRDCESSDTLAAENSAIEKVLTHWQRLTGLFGGALMVEGRMAAYTIGEALGGDTLVIHFEKGDPDYKGVYQAINQQFLFHAGGDFDFVNREQDLGDPGLRKAKRSYHPVGYLKKVRVTFCG